MGFSYISSKKGNVSFIRIGGALDTMAASDFYKKLRGEVDRGAQYIICNMEGIDHITSAGLGALISVNDILDKKGGEIRLSSISAKTRRIFKLLGFLTLFTICTSDREALQTLGVY